MRQLPIIVVALWVAVGCSSVKETEADHFRRDYLDAEEPKLHGFGISYEQLGTLRRGEPLLIGVRGEDCQRRLVQGTYIDIDMRAYACNADCRRYRAVSVYDRSSILPYHSIFRGISYDQLVTSPFINAEIYVLVGADTTAIPLWQVDAIVPQQVR